MSMKPSFYALISPLKHNLKGISPLSGDSPFPFSILYLIYCVYRVNLENDKRQRTILYNNNDYIGLGTWNLNILIIYYDLEGRFVYNG